MVKPGLKWPPEVPYIELLNVRSYIMRSTSGATYHTNRESEHDPDCVCNTDLEETYTTQRILPQFCTQSSARKKYALPRPGILRMLPRTKHAVAPAPANV